MLEYIFKRSEPYIVPKILIPTLEENDIMTEDITLCVPTDRSIENISSDTYIILAKDQLVVISGNVTSTIQKRKNTRSFRLLSIDRLTAND